MTALTITNSFFIYFDHNPNVKKLRRKFLRWYYANF